MRFAAKDLYGQPIKGKSGPIDTLSALMGCNIKILKKLLFLHNNYVQHHTLPYDEVTIESMDIKESYIYFRVDNDKIPIQLITVQNLIYDCINARPISKEQLKRMNTMWSNLTENAGLQKVGIKQE